VSEGAGPTAGWYPDPWFTGQHRFWSGRAWTGDVFPDGPAGSTAAPVVPRPASERPPSSPPTARSAQPPPAPTFAYTATLAPPTDPMGPWDLMESEPPRRRLPVTWQVNALALVVGLIVGFFVVERAVSDHGSNSSASRPPAFTPQQPPSAVPTSPASDDPSAPLLQRLVVRQVDVPPTSTVQLLDGGNLDTGETTLDLCNGTYPSEALRGARLQVVELARDGTDALSTEAVLYRTPADAAQAMTELQHVAASCPAHDVVSPVGEPTVTTRFKAPPDRSWPQVAGVTRQAYAFTTTDASGQTDTAVAVYLRRGRLLEGVYFHSPAGAQPAVDGQTTVADITHVFEQRIAAVPGASIGG